ncbi:MAG: ring-cleaving dioxygenase [Halobacteriota archaeon]
MPPPTIGIHHVTAIGGAPEPTLSFYRTTLGFRLVKRTVNFDDPTTYHLYFGDRIGSPGSILTFFPMPDAPPGRPGGGQVVTTRLAVPSGSLGWWTDHLEAADVEVDRRTTFDEPILRIADPDGLAIELTERDIDAPVHRGVVPSARAIRGLDGITVRSTAPDDTADVLEHLGLEQVDRGGDRRRLVAGGDRGAMVDVLADAGDPGRMGPGTVHHVAFRVPDDEAQAAWQADLRDAGHRVTDVRDRQYFRSIYFREPGGILFELATDGPGFDRDEPVDALGETVQLPPWLSDDRERIVAGLPNLPTETPGAP